MSAQGRQRPVLGLIYVVVVALLVGLSVGIYNKALPWQDSAEVTFTSTQVGLGLRPLSDVKFQGVLVGEVREVTTTGKVATVTLGLDPERIGTIPAGVDAMVVPKTLFGDKFVDLRQPAGGAGSARLEDGATIAQSSTAVELGEVFDRLVPVLQTLQPERLSVILGELAAALDGQGDDIAAALTRTEDLLTELEPSYGDLVEDVRLLTATADVYTDAGPDLLSVLDDAAAISNGNLVPHEGDIAALLASASTVSAKAETVLRENTEHIVQLSGRVRPVLRVLEAYSDTVPCILKALDYGNRLANLASGVRGPYIQLSVDMIVDGRAYAYPDDLPHNPKSDTNLGNLPAEVPGWEPHCPQLPERVLALGQTPPPYSQPPYGQVYDTEGGDGGAPPARRPGDDAAVSAARAALARAVAAETLGVTVEELPPYTELLLLPLTATGEVVLP